MFIYSFLILFQSTRPRSQVVVVFFPLNRTLSSKSASIVSRQERLMPRKRRQIQNGMMISLCKSNNSSCSDTYRAWSKMKKTKCISFHGYWNWIWCIEFYFKKWYVLESWWKTEKSIRDLIQVPWTKFTLPWYCLACEFSGWSPPTPD